MTTPKLVSSLSIVRREPDHPMSGIGQGAAVLPRPAPHAHRRTSFLHLRLATRSLSSRYGGPRRSVGRRSLGGGPWWGRRSHRPAARRRWSAAERLAMTRRSCRQAEITAAPPLRTGARHQRLTCWLVFTPDARLHEPATRRPPTRSCLAGAGAEPVPMTQHHHQRRDQPRRRPATVRAFNNPPQLPACPASATAAHSHTRSCARRRAGEPAARRTMLCPPTRCRRDRRPRPTDVDRRPDRPPAGCRRPPAVSRRMADHRPPSGAVR